MNLSDSEKSRALALFETWADNSARIFVRMLLLPAMIDLGFPGEKCIAVCRSGLSQVEVYLRLQAARLLTVVGDKHPLNEVDIEKLIHDRDVGVRIYAAKIHWRKNRQAAAIVPVLIESLDRAKHQSYYYVETQPVALSLLGEIGPEARDAIGTLEKLVNDPNPAIAKLASEALAKIRRQ